jgi:glutamyl-tRNA synthetase
MDEDLKELIRAFALRNATQHGGQARMSSVMGAVLSARPDARSQAGEIAQAVGAVLEEVNSIPAEDQRAQLDELELPGGGEDRAQPPGLPDLAQAIEGEVVMRLAPYPSGPLHLGHARMALLNDEYVKRYDGKLILVIDDTAGSAEKIPILEAYESIPRDLEWMGVEVHETVYKSDRLEIFYSYARRFLEEEWAYVCLCDVGRLRKDRAEGRECECRPSSREDNLARWDKMLSGGYAEGEAVVRLKTDMKDPDAAFRDRVLLRISERPHPRVGTRYRVWPMLEFSWAIDDHLLGVTHVLRGKDLMMEDRMERFMWNLLGWPEPAIIHHGTLGIADARMSSSECRRRIEAGEYDGWRDPRTWTLDSLKARGIQPEAIRSFIIACGLTLTDVRVPVDSLYAENRKMIDPVANRYNLVRDPVGISVSGAPDVDAARLRLHPDFEERGVRTVPVVPGSIHVDGRDFAKNRGKVVRLKDLYNVLLDRDAEYRGSELSSSMSKIQWVSGCARRASVIMPDGCTGSLSQGDLVQFVRFGFCRLDSRDGDQATFRFAHG